MYGASGWDREAYLLPGVDLAFSDIRFPKMSVVVLNLRAPSVLLGYELGGIVGHRFLSRYRVTFDLEPGRAPPEEVLTYATRPGAGHHPGAFVPACAVQDGVSRSCIPIQNWNRALRHTSALPACSRSSASSQFLLNSVRHDQSKWIGNPRANVSRPMPYDARPSTRRNPLMATGSP